MGIIGETNTSNLFFSCIWAGGARNGGGCFQQPNHIVPWDWGWPLHVIQDHQYKEACSEGIAEVVFDGFDMLLIHCSKTDEIFPSSID